MSEEKQEGSKEQTRELVIRRILVAVDTSAHSMAALNAAARLASAMQAELTGLFVEDVNLLRLAALPFAKELRWPSSSRRTLDEVRMERELQLMASQARRALATVAEEAEAEWTFRVVRGTVSEEVLNAALEADLLSLGRASRPLTRRVRLGSTAQAAAIHASGSVLLARKGTDTELPIAVTYDGTQAATRVIDAAVRMSHINDSNLIVLVMAEQADEAPHLAERASHLLGDRISHAEYRFLPTNGDESLADVLAKERCALVVLGGDIPSLQGKRLYHLLDDLDCPVLLVR
jgi:nucleotide-binding universal stress UspA family protein